MGDNQLSELQGILSECGLENRLLILNMMGDRSLTASQIRSNLKKSGIVKPFSTVGRYLRCLEKVDLIHEDAEGFHLSNLGIYITKCFNCMVQNKAALDAHRGFMDRFTVSPIPVRFMCGLSALNHAERVTDSFSFVSTFMEAIGNAGESINLVADKVSIQFFEHIASRVVDGVAYKGINGRKNTPTRLDYVGKMISKFKLDEKTLPAFKDRFQMKEHGGVPIHVIIVDDGLAGINFPYRDGRSHLEAAFVSENKVFVEWVNGIFEYFWSKGDPIKY